VKLYAIYSSRIGEDGRIVGPLFSDHGQALLERDRMRKDDEWYEYSLHVRPHDLAPPPPTPVPVVYAVWAVSDQTYTFVGAEGCMTTVHADARLWTDEAEARTVARSLGSTPRTMGMVEAIADVAEFKAREDTW
jgi:hypothetical protein